MTFSKTLSLMLGCIAIINAQSTCRISVETFSDSTCTTSTNTVTFNANMNTCFEGDDGVYLDIIVCDETKYTAFEMYQDETCSLQATPAVNALWYDECQWWKPNVWIKAAAPTLTGNKYGITWGEGWGIFLCQTVLFGVCAGY